MASSPVVLKTYAYIPRSATQFLEHNPELIERCKSIRCSISSDVISIKNTLIPVISLRSSNNRRKVHALAIEIARKSKMRVVVRIIHQRNLKSRSKSILGIHNTDDGSSENESDNDTDDDEGVECYNADNEKNSESTKDKDNNRGKVIAEYRHGMLKLEINDVKEFASGAGETGDTGEGENRYMNGGGENPDANGGMNRNVNTSGGGGGNHGHTIGGGENSRTVSSTVNWTYTGIGTALDSSLSIVFPRIPPECDEIPYLGEVVLKLNPGTRWKMTKGYIGAVMGKTGFDISGTASLPNPTLVQEGWAITFSAGITAIAIPYIGTKFSRTRKYIKQETGFHASLVGNEYLSQGITHMIKPNSKKAEIRGTLSIAIQIQPFVRKDKTKNPVPIDLEIFSFYRGRPTVASKGVREYTIFAQRIELNDIYSYSTTSRSLNATLDVDEVELNGPSILPTSVQQLPSLPSSSSPSHFSPSSPSPSSMAWMKTTRTRKSTAPSAEIDIPPASNVEFSLGSVKRDLACARRGASSA